MIPQLDRQWGQISLSISHQSRRSSSANRQAKLIKFEVF